MQQPAQANQPTPQQVFEEAHRFLRLGDVHEAARRAGKLRAYFPDDTPILALHGVVLARLNLHPQALSDLVRAAQATEEALKNDEEGNPARPRIVDQLIRLSVQICRSSTALGEFDAASEAIENALGWDPDRADAVGAKAELLSAQGDHTQALDIIAKGFEEKLDTFPLTLARARVLFNDASANAEALHGVIPELERESAVSGLPALDLGDLLRVMGMIHDRLGEHDEAFNAFRRAARLRRASKYDPRTYTLMTTKVITDWSLSNMSKVIKPDVRADKFVLVLGAPKSGVEQLGSMLGQFDGASLVGPLETLSLVCTQNLNARQGILRPVPFEPSKLRGNQLKEAHASYTGQVQAIAGTQGTVCIDTHPLNIPLAGAAALMLPGVHIVLCRRDPIESALGCYCDAMPGNHPYASDLLDSAGFVADSNRMLDHWAATLGEGAIGANIIEVQYSELAADPAKTAARVAEAIGLDAKAADVERIPAMEHGPSTHAQDYRNFTRQIRDLLEPSDAKPV